MLPLGDTSLQQLYCYFNKIFCNCIRKLNLGISIASIVCYVKFKAGVFIILFFINIFFHLHFEKE